MCKSSQSVSIYILQIKLLIAFTHLFVYKGLNCQMYYALISQVNTGKPNLHDITVAIWSGAILYCTKLYCTTLLIAH